MAKTQVVIDRAKKQENKKLDKLVTKANRILARVDSMFPFDLFPDTILVDENKVDIIRRRFFFTEDVISILLRDIKTVWVSTTLFFASIRFDIRGYEENPEQVRFLPKRQAMQVRRIVAGLIAGEKKKIDFSKIKTDELADKAEEIGAAVENE